MSPDDPALTYLLLSLLAVAVVILVLSVVLAPIQFRNVPKDAPKLRRSILAFRRAIGLSALVVGGLILILQATLVCIALATSIALVNQAPSLETAVLQVAVCGAIYRVAAGAAPTGAPPPTDGESL